MIKFVKKIKIMTRVLEATKFTPIQLELLNFFSTNPTDDELLEVRRFLVKLKMEKALNEIAEEAEKRGYTNEDLDKWLEDENQ